MTSWKVQNEKFCAKIKNLNFRPKEALLEYFRLKFEKANVMFEINALEFMEILKIKKNNNDH